MVTGAAYPSDSRWRQLSRSAGSATAGAQETFLNTRAPRCAAARRAAGVQRPGARGAPPADRGRRGQRRPGRGPRRLPGAVPADRDDEPLSLRCARRPGAGVLVLDAAARLVSGEALARAARPLRPRRDGAAAARHRACARARPRRRPGRGASRAARRRLAAGRRAGRPRRTSSSPRRRATAAFGPRPCPGRARRRTAAALAGSDAVLPEHVAEALGYRSPRELEAT